MTETTHATSDSGSTLPGVFAIRAAQFPERVWLSFLREEGIETVTYGEAARRIAGIAEWLRREGFAKGDRIVCYLDEHEPLIWMLMGCAVSGIVPIPLGPAYLPKSMQKLARGCAAKAVFTTPEHADAARTADLPVLLLGLDQAPQPDGVKTIRSLPVTDPVARLKELAAEIDPGELFVILTTSGSTGNPKLVRMPHSGHLWGARTMADSWTAEREGPDVAILLTGAMTHATGQISLVIATELGGQLCIPRDLDTSVRLAEVEQFDPSVLAVVPRTLRSLLEQHRARYGSQAAVTPFCGRRLRRLYTGGAGMDEAQMRFLEERGVEVLEVFGATETCFVAFTRPGRRRPGYAGEVLPGVDLKVASEGELLVRSPYGTLGLEGDDAVTCDAFDEEGYYRTGDLVTIDDGYLRVLGRKRDVLHSSEGSYIYPAVIEERIEAMPWVEQAILLGDDKPYVIALIVPAASVRVDGEHGYLDPARNPDLYRDAQRALDDLNTQLDAFARIRRFSLFGERFPAAVYAKLATGKVARHRGSALELYQRWIAELYESVGSSGRSLSMPLPTPSSTIPSPDSLSRVLWVSGPAGKLRVSDGGDAGVPVVFVHGLAGAHTVWAAQLEHLRQRRRAVALDLHGLGESAPSSRGEYTVQSFVGDLEAVVDALELSRFVLVGHSMGASVAGAYAGAHPERVTGLLLVDPVGDYTQVPEQEVQAIQQGMGDETYDRFMDEFFRTLLAQAAPGVREKVLAQLYATRREVMQKADVYTYAPLPALRRYLGPKLTLFTELNGASFSLHNLLPELPRKALKGVSHWPMLDKPEEFNRTMDEFLASIEGEADGS